METSWKDNLKKAQEELTKKPIGTIQYEAAISWGARAYIAYQNFLKNKDIRWWSAGCEYWREFCQNGALVDEKYQKILEEIKVQVEKVKDDADLIIRKKSFV